MIVSYMYIDNIFIYVIYIYTSTFNQQLHIEEIYQMYHLVPSFTVFPGLVLLEVWSTDVYQSANWVTSQE